MNTIKFRICPLLSATNDSGLVPVEFYKSLAIITNAKGTVLPGMGQVLASDNIVHGNRFVIQKLFSLHINEAVICRHLCELFINFINFSIDKRLIQRVIVCGSEMVGGAGTACY